ncbi:hypothetical protein [Streptomyces sp. Isolate_45]|uniref:hypothetical protein n=1 Tax=Streptomyces sp. Isolate_45 TaxID=2950111 RepID=UPI002481CC23|nr:hypothetical protein [Streptomyces sp. Isolate_45]MDA5282537.1 hypothetical protein [Streptomyces sp. Isolate_45]
MSGDNSAGMVAWVDLAVRAVGPVAGRNYEAWLAEVDQVAVDLWLMSAPGGTVGRRATELSTCVPVTGVLVSAGVSGGEAHARLVVRVREATSGTSDERTYTTEELTGRWARDVFERARSLVGQGVQLLVSQGSEQLRVLHIGGSGLRESGTNAGEAAHEPVRNSTRSPAATAQPAPAASAQPAPAPPSVVGVTWEEGSVLVWRNIDRSWDATYRTSCLLALRDRVVLDNAGFVSNLDELVALAQESPDPDTPRGKDIIARYPA